jgi:hypothetical protein
MAYTKGALVTSALSELGLADYEFDISAEELSSGVRRLDSMMAAWSDMGLRLSYSDGGPDDDSGIPGVAVEAVISNLALRLAPSYGKQVLPEVKVTAKAALNSLFRVSTHPTEMRLGMMPKGAGYKSLEEPFTDVEKQGTLAPVADDVDISGGPDGS